jgi:hypothetical protein
MTMRAAVERSAAQPDDPWGRPGKPSYAAVGTVACRAWSKSRREVRDGHQVVIEDMRAIVPVDSGVSEQDRLTIRDRLGAVIFGGPVAVETVVPRGPRSQTGHLELMLRRHSTQGAA